MLRRSERLVPAFFLVALSLVATGSVLVDRNTRAVVDSERWVTHTHDVLQQLDGVLLDLREAESAERGYVLTGDEALLEPYLHAHVRAEARVARVAALVADDAVQERRADTLRLAARRKLRSMRDIVDARRAAGVEAATRVLVTQGGPAQMAAVERAVAAMDTEERRLLGERRAELTASTRGTSRTIAAFGGVSIALLSAAFALAHRARARRAAAEQQAASVNAQLALRVGELEARTEARRFMQELAEALQLCLTPAEAHGVIARLLPGIEPEGGGGMLAILRSSRNRVERVAAWGTLAGDGALAYAPEDCCALRSGRAYLTRADDARVRCAHNASDGSDARADSLCLPLLAHGETHGVLHLTWPAGRRPDQGVDDDPLGLVRAAAEQIGVALANLELRERLRQQSIRDPLTGAFNRRYLEESLEREVSRARRHRKPLAVLMLDVDHFKRVNDRYGHEAGDVVLRDVVQVLTRAVREEDVVCRYGGEEFAVLLPDMPEEVALVRAEAIVGSLRALFVTHGGERIGPVTASIGVAVYPEHADSGAELVRLADAALYEAKRAGRDRVVVA